ncbi:MAG: prephenate dehydratase [Burkholderiaceae bacterium]|jgi:chorismate mutase/prephenate dehydratase|nr:prephenate dehydratase [Burkholderiaceae bacterium]
MDDPLEQRLKPLRDTIDAIDARLVQLLNERARTAAEVGRIKHEVGAPVFRPEREAEVLRKVAAKSAGPLGEAALSNVFREVMSACRALERPLTIAFLGPVGTFSETAMQRQFGASVNGLPCSTLDEVFRATEAGGADFGIVPIENSSEGAVSRTLDLLLATPLRVLGEVSVPVHHNLLTRSGSMDGVARICAHSQALAQCTGWLNQHWPAVERQAVASNAEAARMASEEPALAAIAGERAAQRYGLHVVAAHIQDDPNNRTRFAVLGDQATQPSAPPGRDKTSLILSVPNRAGAVFDMLKPLAAHGVSMTRFESRPARVGTWEYYFYVDLEGHADDPKVAAALTELQRECAFYKCLGSYPAEK